MDLAKHSCMTFSHSTGERTWRFARPGRYEQVRIRGNLPGYHSETLREAALAGLGLILMPTSPVGSDLKPVLIDWRENVGRQPSAAHHEGGIYAVYLAGRRASGEVHAFREFLARKFGSPPYWGSAPKCIRPGRSKRDLLPPAGLAGGQRHHVIAPRE